MSMDTAEEIPAFAPPRSSRDLAIDDLTHGLSRWWMWMAMAWQDILQRYRGSTLGPFWLTLSMAIMIVTLGFLYSRLFQLKMDEYIPYLCLGLISWGLISSVLTDGCNAFIMAEAIIKQVKIPLSVHVYRVVYRNLVIAAHNLVVYALVLIYFRISLSWTVLLVIPGLVLVSLTAAWWTLLVGMICARFRDVPQIIANLVQVVFFVSPIMWKPELLGDRLWVARLNPAYAFIELIRAPLLNTAPDGYSWFMAIGVTVVGWIATFLFFTRFRARIAYWV